MSDRSTRPTRPVSSAKAKAMAGVPWAALIAAIPAIIMAWKAGDVADSAKSTAQKGVEVLSTQGYERDDRTWRYTRYVLDRQAEDIKSCLDQINALEELYSKDGRRPRARAARAPDPVQPTPRPAPTALELPETLSDVQKAGEGL